MTRDSDPIGTVPDDPELGAIIAHHKMLEGPLLPVLHAIQSARGYISDDAIRLVAHGLNLSRADVHGVVSFYHDFRTHPETRPVIKLCRAEACQARGSEALANFAQQHAGDKIIISPVYCLGLCSVGPNAMIGSTVHARLDQAALSALMKAM